MLSFELAFCAFLLISWFSGVESASKSKLVTPDTNSVFQAGVRSKIEWNPSTDSSEQFYGNFTRISIELYESGSDKYLATVVNNFPFVLGQIYWRVPYNVTVTRGLFRTQRNISIGNEFDKSYYMILYPSFFDWPDSCPGCKDKVPKGESFMILPAACKSQECQAFLSKVDTSAETLPGEGTRQSYLFVLQSIGVGIGAVFSIGFIVAFFVYTKQGKKTWQKYRRKRSGMLYKYRPPVTEASGTQNSGASGKRGNRDSALGTFFSEDDSRITVEESRLSSIVDRPNSNFTFLPQDSRATSVTFADDFQNIVLGDSQLRNQSSRNFPVLQPPVAAALVKTPTSSRPSSIYQADESAVSTSARSSNDTDRDELENVVVHSPKPVRRPRPPPPLPPALNREDAMRIAATFRSTLRTAPSSNFDSPPSTDISLNQDLADQAAANSASNAVSAAFGNDNETFLRNLPAEILKELEADSSPVMSQLHRRLTENDDNM